MQARPAPPATFPSNWIPSSSFLRPGLLPCLFIKPAQPVSLEAARAQPPLEKPYGAPSRPDASQPPGQALPQRPPTSYCAWLRALCTHGLSDWPVGLVELPQRWLPSQVICSRAKRLPWPHPGPSTPSYEGYQGALSISSGPKAVPPRVWSLRHVLWTELPSDPWRAAQHSGPPAKQA